MFTLPVRDPAAAARIGTLAGLLLVSSLAFVRLTALPMFEDEGSQLHQVYRVLEAHQWLEPLGNGKPLEVWPMVPLVWLGLPPLWVLRGMHVLAGMLSVALTYRLALRTSPPGTAWISGLLLAICPLLVYLQRLSLADMLLCAAAVWVLLCTAAWFQSPGGSRTAALAVSLLAAAVSKMPVGFVLLAVAPLALLLMPAHGRERLRHSGAVWPGLLLAHLPTVALATAVAAVAAVRVWQGREPGFGLQTVAGIGLGYYGNLGAAGGIARPDLLTELAAQLSWPVVAAGLPGVIAGAWLGDWRQRWLAGAGLLPMLAIGYGAHFWYSRYLLFTLPPLTVAAVEGWRLLLARAMHPALRLPAAAALLLGCTLLMGRQSMWLILDPLAARWSALDRAQYIESWGSGYGYPEAARFICRSADVPPLIFSLDGHSAYQLRSYLPVRWNVRIQPLLDGPGELSSERERLDYLLSHEPAWIVISSQLLDRYLQSVFGPQNATQIGLRKVATFDKPGSHVQLGIYLAAPPQPAPGAGPEPQETTAAPAGREAAASAVKDCD
jgi:hypothetical protein